MRKKQVKEEPVWGREEGYSGRSSDAPTLRDETSTETAGGGRRIRLSAFAGRYSNDEWFEQVTQVQEAAEVAVGRGAGLLMLPGYSFGRAPVRGHVIQELADRTGLAILAEPDSTWLYKPGEQPRRLLQQLFAEGNDEKNTAENNHAVIEALGQEGGSRRIDMCGVRIGVLLCGESTIVVNRRDGYTGLRAPELVWPGTYDVLLNPSHSTMKRWRELKGTFGFLSAGGRTLIHATNRGHPNDKTQRRAWGSTLAVYRNGTQIASGDPHEGVPGILWDQSQRDDWRMITVDVEAIHAVDESR